jgi:hypothetical protein
LRGTQKRVEGSQGRREKPLVINPKQNLKGAIWGVSRLPCIAFDFTFAFGIYVAEKPQE